MDNDDFSYDTSATLVGSDVENIQLKDTIAAIYVLDKTLCKFAEEIKEFLTQDCEINVCDEEHWSKHIGDTIAETFANFKKCISTHEKTFTYTYKVDTTIIDIPVRDYGYLKRSITEEKRSVDVIILLGHSSVLLAEDKDLVETFAKIGPTIIAFVGCCGGNTRYGPILTMSYLLPTHHTPIIAFYQRQVYKNEIKDTSLMVGIRYYLHIKHGDKMSTLQKMCNASVARCAFALAKILSSMCTDPTVFIDDRDGENFVYNLYDMKTDVVPLPYIQLAVYKSVVVRSKKFWSKFKQEVNAEFEARWKVLLPHSSESSYYSVASIESDKATVSKNMECTDAGSRSELVINKAKMDTIPETVTSSVASSSVSSGIGTECSDDNTSEVNTDSLTNSSVRSSVSSGIGTESSDDNNPEFVTNSLVSYGIGTDSSDDVFTTNYKVEEPVEETVNDNLVNYIHVLNKKAREKIEELQLHRMIPLICEIKFIKLLEDTLQLMRTGDKSSWEKIDPLQFLVAALRGHWGKNSLTDIKIWATYHLMQTMKNNSKLSHLYKLCCVCFVLLCEDSFVRFDEKDQHWIIVCTKQGGELVNVTDELSKELPDPGGPFPTDGELTGWTNLLQHCEYKPECVNLYDKSTHHWTVRNDYRITPQRQMDTHQYTYEELLLCLGALSDGALNAHNSKNTLRQVYYNVSQFYNVNNMDRGYTQYFSNADILTAMYGMIDKDIFYIETKLLLNGYKILQEESQNSLLLEYTTDPAMQPVANESILDTVIKESRSNWKKVSSCRFVFAQFDTGPITPTNNIITGILFYTDTHYGQNLIEFNQAQLNELDKCTDVPKKCFDKLPPALQTPAERGQGRRVLENQLINAIKGLCPPCRYRMLDITIKEIETSNNKIFPFIKVGRLTLKYNENEHLAEVHLNKCA